MRARLIASLCGWIVAIAAADPLSFDTSGGDAWTFEAELSGDLGQHPCDEVIVQSPAGSRQALRLERRFTVKVPLLPGSNSIEAICRERGREIARSDVHHWRVRLADKPKAWVRLGFAGERIRLDAGRTKRAPAHAVPLVRYEWYAREGNPSMLQVVDGQVLDTSKPTLGEHLALSAPAISGEYYVRLRAIDALGRSDESVAVFRVSDSRPEPVQLEFQHPSWVDRAIIYGATPYVFDPQTFRGIQARLEEIAALGANVLWLSPINAAADDDFGYAVTDHFDLRRRFGTAGSFRALVAEAHRLGLKVIIDFVPNHVSDRHPYHLDAAEHSRKSPYYDWFERSEDGAIAQYFDWTHLKNLDYDNLEVQNYIIEAFGYLVRAFDVDGFRVDASWAVAERAPEFWPHLRAELKRIDPDIFLLAEASARDPYHVANGFDAAYDWTEKLGEWAWHDVFDEGRADLNKLRAALTNEGRGFPTDSRILRFLNNNDTGERFATRHGVPMARIAATLLFTLPGIPLIYNGDEMGAAFLPYDEGPPLQWNDTHPLAMHYRQLTSLRSDREALRSGDLQLLKTNQDEEVLAYVRSSADLEEVLVLLNFSDREIRLEGADPQTRATLRRFSGGTDLLTGQMSVDRQGLRIGAETAVLLSKAARDEVME